MNRAEKRMCIQITEKMLARPLFKCLSIDKQETEVTKLSFQESKWIMQDTTDFSIILGKLKNNEYQNVDEWAEDCSKGWNDILNNFSKKSIIYDIALEQKNWFQKRLLLMPHSEEDEWYFEFAKISKQFQKLINNPSKNITSEKWS